MEIAARLRKAATEEWRAGMNLVERRYPERWGRRQAHEHTGPGRQPLRLGEVIFDGGVCPSVPRFGSGPDQAADLAIKDL